MNLTHESRQLLEEVRRLDGPTAESRTRVRHRLARSTRNHVPTISSRTVAGIAHGAVALVPMITKIVAAAAATLIVTAAGERVLKRYTSDGEPTRIVDHAGASRERTQVGPRPEKAPAGVGGSGAQQEEADPPPETLDAPETLVVATRGKQRAESEKVGAIAKEDSDGVQASSISDDVATLKAANAALERGDYNSALALLDSQPPVALFVEYVALRILALCGSGRYAEGKTLKVDYLANHEDSPMAHRVRGACLQRGE